MKEDGHKRSNEKSIFFKGQPESSQHWFSLNL